MNKEIEKYENCKEGSIAFITINERPEYAFLFLNTDENTNEDEILEDVKEKASITYKKYAVKINGEIEGYLETLDIAQKLVDEMNDKYLSQIDVDLTIEEIFTEEVPELTEYTVAQSSFEEVLDIKVAAKKAEEAKKAASRYISIPGVNPSYATTEKLDLYGLDLLSPVYGSVTSRYLSVSSIRTSAHKGIDIGASIGTEIKAAASGIVKFASYDKYYGNYVIIEHANGISTCYAHCKELYVEAGDKVEQGQTIATVGMTGNTSGPHLHFEIRVDNVAVNPQYYLYN